MSVELTNKIVKCRKSHPCDWCGEGIKTGEEAHYRTGVYDGDFYHGYLHDECHTALLDSDFGYDDEYTLRGQQRGKTLEESHE